MILLILLWYLCCAVTVSFRIVVDFEKISCYLISWIPVEKLFTRWITWLVNIDWSNMFESNNYNIIAPPMAAVDAPMRSSRNTEKRRERSKVAARCRRGKESEIFTELSNCLPVSESSKANMDKASIMRLTLCDLKLRKMMENGKKKFPCNMIFFGTHVFSLLKKNYKICLCCFIWFSGRIQEKIKNR